MTPPRDPALRALERLRRSVAEPAPDPALEARLRERFHARRERRRRWLPFVGLGLLSGAAFAGGAGWLRSWWYSIEIGDQRVSERVDGPGERSHVFTGADGTTTTVRVGREELAGDALRTRIDVRSAGPERIEELHAEDVQGSSARRRVRRAEIAIGEPLFSGRDASGRAIDLFAGTDPREEAPVTRLYLARAGDDGAPSDELEDLGPAPAWLLDPRCRPSIAVRAGGELVLTCMTPAGPEQEVLRLDPAPGPPTGFEAGDGRLRVRVEERPRVIVR